MMMVPFGRSVCLLLICLLLFIISPEDRGQPCVALFCVCTIDHAADVMVVRKAMRNLTQYSRLNIEQISVYLRTTEGHVKITRWIFLKYFFNMA